MRPSRHKLYSFILFLCLSLFAGVFEYYLYNSRVEDIEERTSYLFRVENQRVEHYLKRYSDVLSEYRKDFEKNQSFDPHVFENLAQQFSLHFKDIKAFNFISSDYFITHVYPKEANKAALGKNLKNHPDSVVAKLFTEGISRSGLTFLPPVSIYQGGKAVIFYMPIKFKGGETGWFNVVILAENLFKNYRSSNDFAHVDFLVRDSKTNRFFIAPKNSNNRQILSYSTFLFGRDIDYIFNVGPDLEREMDRSIQDFTVLLIVIVFFVILFFLYSKGREELYLNYLNIRNESNLLKTLIHDISNPIQVVLLGLQSVKIKGKSIRDGSVNLDYLIQNQMSAAEVITTVRNIYNNNKDILVNEPFEIWPVLDDVLASVSEDLIKLDLKVKKNISKDILDNTTLGKEVFKNHVLKNLISNAVKFSVPGSQLDIIYDGKELVIRNLAKTIEPARFEELNAVKEQQSTLDNQGKSSLGLGLFIAKVFCLHGKVKLHISQNEISGIVTTKLTF